MIGRSAAFAVAYKEGSTTRLVLFGGNGGAGDVLHWQSSSLCAKLGGGDIRSTLLDEGRGGSAIRRNRRTLAHLCRSAFYPPPAFRSKSLKEFGVPAALKMDFDG
jgi:hypothetical protein